MKLPKEFTKIRSVSKLSLLAIFLISVIIIYLITKLQNSFQPQAKDLLQRKSSNKTVTWLGHTYDVDNPGHEFEDKTLRIISSSDWSISSKPYFISSGDLENVEMDEGNSWESYSKAKEILKDLDLSNEQRKYFYDNNYVPRVVEKFDVTGDGVSETIVTSLTLGCGRCVDFYFVIFMNDRRFIARASEGALLKTKNGNGFYLTNYFWSKTGTTIYISKYNWNKSLFTETARKEIELVPRK